MKIECCLLISALTMRFICLRRNTLQRTVARTVAQAMAARRRLAAGMKGKANYGEIPL